MFHPLIDHILSAPPEQLDPQMVEKIKSWSTPATPLEILEVLDASIYGALASGIVIAALQALLGVALQRENQTLDDIVAQATWRTQ